MKMTKTHADLTDFLLARIAEDEADARHAGADAMMGQRWKRYPKDAYDELQSVVLSASRRALADCEAKREIVEMMKDTEHVAVASDGWTVAKFAVRYLAAVYADHPDYRDEWRA